MSTAHSLRPTKDWCRAHSAKRTPGPSPAQEARARQRALASKRPTQLRNRP